MENFHSSYVFFLFLFVSHHIPLTKRHSHCGLMSVALSEREAERSGTRNKNNPISNLPMPSPWRCCCCSVRFPYGCSSSHTASFWCKLNIVWRWALLGVCFSSAVVQPYVCVWQSERNIKKKPPACQKRCQRPDTGPFATANFNHHNDQHDTAAVGRWWMATRTAFVPFRE